MDATQFLSALLAIIVIDLVLAGDNAIVIALAARALPQHLQKRAIVWGAVGAIVVRSAMTAAVVWLLKIPGLLLAGGVLLLWIAYKLLLPEDGDAHDDHPAATTFWGAMRTIVIADAVMGLDNVLAVAGAAHGSYLLVVAGLVISVPIVIWGSTVVLKVVDRYPGVVYIGAGVLVWTATKMMLGEPLVKPYVERWPVLAVLVWLLIPLVLWLGFVKNHRQLESRIHARLEALRRRFGGQAEGAAAVSTHSIEGDNEMHKVLVPVDGSPNALLAVRHVMQEHRRAGALEVHLLNVQPQLSRHVARFVSRSDRDAWHQDRARAAMADARALLEQAGVPLQTHWSVGDRAQQICETAQRLRAQRVVMGTARKNSLTRMLEDSTTSKVLELTEVPVEVITGPAISRWERWALPASVVGLGWLLFMEMTTPH